MLTTLRKSAGGFVAKVLFGLLVISFAVWGIGDVFRSTSSNNVAQVGETEVPAEAFRTQFANTLQRIGQQFGRPLSPQEAQAIGLDQQVLGELVTEAALDERARTLGLAISDDAIAQSIVEDAIFRGADGRFDRQRFDQILRSNNLTEQDFVQAQRRFLLRQQLLAALTSNIAAPRSLTEAAHRHQSEERAVRYVVLNPPAAGEIAAPADDVLEGFFKERTSSFRAPERRSFNYLALTPETLALQETVSEADVRARYDQNRQRFVTPERRTIQRINFQSFEEAQKASQEIASGETTFDQLIQNRNLGAADYDLGMVTLQEVIDQRVAEAAFSLPVGEVSGPVRGQFSSAIVRVTASEAEVVQSFEDVQAELSNEIAQERAHSRILQEHDKIEDTRAGGATLAEVAKQAGLEVSTVEGVDQQGNLPDGTAADIPARAQVIAEAFEADVGVEVDAVRTEDGGYVWLEVSKVDPARDRTFEEAKQDVLAAWRNEQARQQLDAETEKLAADARGDGGLSAAAQSRSIELLTASDIRRQGNDVFGQAATEAIFSTAQGAIGSAPAADESQRVVFEVIAIEVPPVTAAGTEIEAMAERLGQTLENDVAAQYIAQLQTALGATVNRTVLNATLGVQTDQ